jgi:hypothetical protein
VWRLKCVADHGARDPAYSSLPTYLRPPSNFGPSANIGFRLDGTYHRAVRDHGSSGSEPTRDLRGLGHDQDCLVPAAYG